MSLESELDDECLYDSSCIIFRYIRCWRKVYARKMSIVSSFYLISSPTLMSGCRVKFLPSSKSLESFKLGFTARFLEYIFPLEKELIEVS